MRDKILLRQLQALPLDAKVLMTQQRIREWYNYWNGNVYTSFSGGKDSTVLLHLVHDMYPEVPFVFANTGLEYQEIRQFAESKGAEVVYPKMRFDQVISRYGYPIIGKEIAEAIYYARRIISDGGGYKKNRDAERTTFKDNEWTKTDRAGRLTGQRSLYPPQLQELRGRTGWRRANLTGNTPPPKQRKKGKSGEPENSSCGSCRTGVGSSQFNKRKWLPLCHETDFQISHYCCNVMKKSPMGIYQRKAKRFPYIGTLAEESRMREQAWIRHGCNAFEGHKKTSQPMSFWTEQDVLQYIKRERIEICSVYGDILAVDESGMMYEPLPGVECKLKCTGCQRTGCIFCGFGCHLEKGESRFQLLARTHPKQYEYCMGGGQYVDNPSYDPTAQKMDGDWKNWNPKKIWVPSKKGLGMRKVFDECNQIYGKDFIRYE